MLTPIAVVPGQDQHDRQPDDEDEHGDLPYLLGPVEGLADVLDALQEPPGGGDVHKPPLDDLAAAQPGPGALGCTLCRRVGQSSAPMPSECSGLPAGARRKPVHSDLKADTHAVSELQHLTRELLEQLTAMFPVEEAADLLRAMADGLEARDRAV